MRAPTPAQARARRIVIRYVIHLLKEARIANVRDFPQLGRRIRQAIKSAEGSLANSSRFVRPYHIAPTAHEVAAVSIELNRMGAGELGDHVLRTKRLTGQCGGVVPVVRPVSASNWWWME